MTTYRDWSITASANTGNAADGFFKENMKYQDVNDAARAMQAILARDRLDKSGTIRTTGTSASYELSVNANLPSLADGDMFVFDAHVKNAGAAELQIKADGTATFSSMAIVNTDLSALSQGQMQAGGVYAAVFRSASASSRQFQLLNPSRTPGNAANAFQSTASGATVYSGINLETALTTVADGAVTLYHNGSAKLATQATGIEVRGGSGDDNLISLANSAGTDLFHIVLYNGVSALDLQGLVNGAPINIKAENTSAVNKTLAIFNPDAGVTLNFDGSAKLATVTGGIDVTGNVSPTGFFNFGPGTELTISSGAVTATGSYHTIDTESDAASDDLDTINGSSNGGDLLILRAENVARTVVLKDGTGNLQLGGDRSLTNTHDTIMLLRAGAGWQEISFADNTA